MPLKVKGEAFGATRRRTIGETLGQSARRRLARGGEKLGFALVVGHRALFASPLRGKRLAALS